ncbi:hypothetical protein ACS0TY_033942 [Phlomoides rotata]
MKENAVNRDFFIPVEVGREKICISHLQFVDDIVFLGKVEVSNIVFLKRFLVLLELVSGLKINLGKSSIYRQNVDEQSLSSYANILGCNMGTLPFKYMGVRIGNSHRKISDWDYVVRKVRNRLRKWENLKISIGGRLVLINSILSSIPDYLLSIFKAPKNILREIAGLQKHFLWGGGECDSKIA